MKLNKKKGILFWVTGLSGSGKTKKKKKISKRIIKTYGPTIVVSGDDMRAIFDLKQYDYQSRLSYMKKFIKFSKFIVDQKINVIFAVVGMMEEPRKWSRVNIENYIEIYIKSNVKNIIKLNKKKIYKSKNKKNIVGISIKSELPKNYDIIINNDFTKNTSVLSNILFNKIKKFIYFRQ